jgi:Ca-activated chloride channel family protein
VTRLLLALAATIVAAGAADQDAKMAIVAPQPDAIISGTTVITLDIVPTAAVQVVNFFVDGRLACTVERPPFACTWEPGAVVRGHHIRVVATFSGGRRLVDNVRTKDLGYAERTEVEAVLVPVIVTEDGRFVRGLRKRDFEVFEDDTPQQVLALASEESPLDLVLAIDISGSMEGALAEVKSAVKLLLAQLRAGDAATLIGFNDNTFLVAEREKDQHAREEAVDLLSAWGGTALYDATVRAVELVGRNPGRKGVVVFSDGDDRHSLTTPDKAAARVQGGNAMLYTVGFGAGAAVTTLRDRLQQYASATGGRAFFPRHSVELARVFGDIVAELSNQYVLSYVSTNTRKDGEWRAIRVRVRSGKYEVRARRGYQAQAPQRAEGEP